PRTIAPRRRKGPKATPAGASSLNLQKCRYAFPDAGQARDQLVIVLEQRQPDVRPCCRERFDGPRIDRCVLPALEDQRRLRKYRVEGIVPETVLIEGNVQHPLGVFGVMEERQPAVVPPLGDSVRREEMVP